MAKKVDQNGDSFFSALLFVNAVAMPYVIKRDNVSAYRMPVDNRQIALSVDNADIL